MHIIDLLPLTITKVVLVVICVGVRKRKERERKKNPSYLSYYVIIKHIYYYKLVISYNSYSIK